MRTTLDIDDELMEALLRRHPGVSKTAAVETAIREHIDRDAIGRARELGGAFPDIVDVTPDRRIDRHS